MKRNLPWGVQKIIIDFIGTNYDCTRGCHAFTKKGKKCKTKPVGDFIFCRKHRNLIKDLSNGDDIKDIAIAYLLMVYKGPNRKKITSKGIISKKVQEVPLWVGGDSCSPLCFYRKKLGRNKKTGYCICPWCIEQYVKFFPRYSDRIIEIIKMIHSNSYPYNSTIDLLNNNVVRINKTIQKKNNKKQVGFWRHTTIHKKRLLHQFGYLDYFDDGAPRILCCEKSPLKSIIETSYTECANNTKSGFKENGFDGIVETQYMKSNSVWSGNSHRLENTCPFVALSSYEIAKIRFSRLLLLNKIVLTGYGLELIPEDVIRLICSFFYDKKTFKKSFLRRKRIQFWKLVNPKRNFWIKIDEEGNPIRQDYGLAGAGGIL
tara:strand:- start:596 stop:1714 length:1119 start_codon:yes stop_codon:yes gene_type:complete